MTTTPTPSPEAARLIPLASHPLNGADPASVLVNGPRNVGRDIYRTRGGYLACVGDRAFERLFASQAEAEAAQAIAAAVGEG